jgi:hypothetical protein
VLLESNASGKLGLLPFNPIQNLKELLEGTAPLTFKLWGLSISLNTLLSGKLYLLCDQLLGHEPSEKTRTMHYPLP